MSEVQSRPMPSRGKGSSRGGRGGLVSRGGGFTNFRANGDAKHDVPAQSAMPSIEDEGEIGHLRKQYGAKVEMIKEIYLDWSDVDILFALQETDGDETVAVTRIAEGTISQWGEVSKQKKDRSQSKAKNDVLASTGGDVAGAGNTRNPRGGRFGTEGGRSGRSRTTERGGRAGIRGKSAHAATNGTRVKENSAVFVPTDESFAWENHKASGETNGGWGDSPSSENTRDNTTVAAEPAASASAARPLGPTTAKTNGAPKTWASMVRQSTASLKPKIAPVPRPAENVVAELPPCVEPPPTQPELESTPTAAATAESVADATDVEASLVVVPEVVLPPPKDQLTEVNLEQMSDNSIKGPETDTLKSEAADSYDPRAVGSASATPISAAQHQHQAPRASPSGYAATAMKATERAAGNRTPSGSHRLLAQQESVRMPGKRDVDRATVQFGAFSLNGAVDDDVDGDREEPETRAQPPPDSPVAHPRTSLPPVYPAPVPDAFAAQKPASVAVPTGPAAHHPPAGLAQPSSAQTAAQVAVQPSQQFGARYGQPAQEPASFTAPKPFDSPFHSQPTAATSATQNELEGGFPGSQTSQPPSQQPSAGLSSAPGDFSSYYAADAPNRNSYNYYGQNYGHQHQNAQGLQDGAPSQQQQRGYGAYTAPHNEGLGQYPQSATAHAQSRFGAAASAADNSGNASNAPTAQAQVAPSNPGPLHGQQQPQDFPAYNAHPYLGNSYYSSYMNYSGYNQGGYGGPYGKANMGGFNQPSYGMQGPLAHAYGSTPAGGFGGQNSLHRGDSGIGGGLGEFGRAGSAQSGAPQGLGGSGYSGMHDAYGRGASAYQNQAAQALSAPGSQLGGGPPGAEDLKHFGDGKGAAGPSPSLASAARPGSAANNGPTPQTGLPPPQSSQQSSLSGMEYGGYPTHLQGHNLQGHNLHGHQSGLSGYAMTGSAGQGGHQNNYGGYGGQGFGGSYYGNPPRGGWGTNYGH